MQIDRTPSAKARAANNIHSSSKENQQLGNRQPSVRWSQEQLPRTAGANILRGSSITACNHAIEKSALRASGGSALAGQAAPSALPLAC